MQPPSNPFPSRWSTRSTPILWCLYIILLCSSLFPHSDLPKIYGNPHHAHQPGAHKFRSHINQKCSSASWSSWSLNQTSQPGSGRKSCSTAKYKALGVVGSGKVCGFGPFCTLSLSLSHVWPDCVSPKCALLLEGKVCSLPRGGTWHN